MDAATLSAFAASAAALFAGAVAGVQLFVGYRQSKAALTAASAAMKSAESQGRHTTAGFRQRWIDTVIETLCDYHSILMTRQDAQELSRTDQRELAALKTKLEILLNPDEADTIELLRITEEIRQSASAADRVEKDPQMVKAACIVEEGMGSHKGGAGIVDRTYRSECPHELL